MLKCRKIISLVLGAAICIASDIYSQQPTTRLFPPSSQPPSPKSGGAASSPSLSQLKEKLRPHTQHPLKPIAPPPPEPPSHPEPYITRGDAKEIFSMIENQMNAIQHNDFATAYYNYTSEPFKKTTSLEEFSYFMSSYPVFTNNKNSIFGSLKLDNNIAHMEGTLTSAGGEVHQVEYFFIQEDGLWKIIGIQILPQPSPQPLPLTTGGPITGPSSSTPPHKEEGSFRMDRHPASKSSAPQPHPFSGVPLQ